MGSKRPLTNELLLFQFLCRLTRPVTEHNNCVGSGYLVLSCDFFGQPIKGFCVAHVRKMDQSEISILDWFGFRDNGSVESIQAG